MKGKEREPTEETATKTRDHTCAPKGLKLEIIRAVCRRKFHRAGDSRSRKRHSLVPCDYRGGARELQMIYIPTRPGLSSWPSPLLNLSASVLNIVG